VPRIVVPFRGADAKRRLAPLSAGERRTLAHAMLTDVLAAATTVGRTIVVTSPRAAEARRRAEAVGADIVDDPSRGQSEAVLQALRGLDDGPVLVVNADLPAVQPADLLALLGHMPPGGIALAQAADGTTNALALASPRLFERLYGNGSAERFRRHAEGVDVAFASADLPNLARDVDRLADLEALAGRLGPATAAVREAILTSAAA
jgi:2-phospho-L-lactate/phosphoenolpyruvate guanylyltransferase